MATTTSAKCQRCRGTGRIQVRSVPQPTRCPRCGGTGRRYTSGAEGRSEVAGGTGGLVAADDRAREQASAVITAALDGSSLTAFPRHVLVHARQLALQGQALQQQLHDEAPAAVAGYYARQVAAYHRAALAVQRHLSTTEEL